MAKGDEIQGADKNKLIEQATGTLTFDTDGRLAEQKINKSAFSFNKGAMPDQYVDFNFGKD